MPKIIQGLRWLTSVGLFFTVWTINVVWAATLYVDVSLGQDCKAGNYAFANRQCSGSDGSAYTTLDKAESSAGPNDTIMVRAGTYTLEAEHPQGLRPKSGQTWRAAPSESVIIVASSKASAFFIHAVAGVTIDGFTIRGAREHAVFVDKSTNITVQNNQISGWNMADKQYRHGIRYHRSSGGLIASNTVYSPAHMSSTGCIALTNGPGNKPGNGGGTLVTNNHVHRCGMGLWLDVDSGNPNKGLPRHTLQGNFVSHTAGHCIHLEARSAAIIRDNVLRDCGQHGIALRLGGTMSQVEIYNNTIYHPQWFGIWINVQHSNPTYKLTDAKITNNVFVSNTPYPQLVIPEPVDKEHSNVIRNNLYWVTHPKKQAICWGQPLGRGALQCLTSAGAKLYRATSVDLDRFQYETGQGQGSLVADPQFVNPHKNDFTLQQGSLAIDKGQNRPIFGAPAMPALLSDHSKGAERLQ
jgi:hypothetical protein